MRRGRRNPGTRPDAQTLALAGPSEQLVGEAMSRTGRGYLTFKPGSQQRQVANQVQGLVPHRLVRPAQAARVLHAGVIENDSVVEASAPREAGGPHRLHFGEELPYR